MGLGPIGRICLFLMTAQLLGGCAIGYLASSGYHQLSLLSDRVPIEKVLKDPAIPEETKRKLRLAVEARTFAETQLGLKETKNYTSYVDLKRPYAAWVVRVSDAYKLSAYHWNFPLVGKVPYKGYFSLEAAIEEAERFPAEQYDTYVQGATAYSTLGWFNDPVLSSMIALPDHQLVNVIIHETVHATLYISGQADFNEQLATFLGDQGTMRFYQNKEGSDSKTMALIKSELHDRELFSAFISTELKALAAWYTEHEGQIGQEEKAARLREIQDRFRADLESELKTDDYTGFAEAKLNNAMLMSFQTYLDDLTLFHKLLAHFDGDFRALLRFCMTLEDSDDAKAEIEKVVGHGLSGA